MKHKVLVIIYIVSTFTLFPQSFEKILAFPDLDFGIADAVFFIDDATIGIYKDTKLEIIGIYNGFRNTVKDNMANWISEYTYRPLIYFDLKNKKLARYEFGGEMQDSGIFCNLYDLRVDWDFYNKMDGRLLFEKDGADSIYTRQALSSSDDKKYLSIEFESVPSTTKFIKKVYWVDTENQIKKELTSIIPFSYRTMLNRKYFRISLDRNEYGFVARSIWWGRRILVLDGEDLKRLANEEGFYDKYIFTDDTDPILEKLDPYIGIYYDLKQTDFLFNETKTFSGSKYVTLKYQPNSWPCRLKLINLDSMMMTYVSLPVFYLFSNYAFDVNPKGNLIVFAEKDTVTGTFKHWSVYRIVLNGIVTEDRALFRKQATTGSEILAQLDKGTKVKVLDRTDTEEMISGMKNYWYKVRLENGKEGWVFGAWLNIEE